MKKVSRLSTSLLYLAFLFLLACKAQDKPVTVNDEGDILVINTGVNTGSLTPNYDDTDFYLPKASGAYPVLFFHPGGKVDKKYYAIFAKQMARKGVLTAISNHKGLFGPMMSEQIVLNRVWEYLLNKNTIADSPFYQKINTNNLFVIGHSFGGVSVFYESQNRCSFPTCVGNLTPPKELKATLAFGANDENNQVGKIDNKYPFLYLQGNIDSKKNSLAKALVTYANIQNKPKMFITLKGVNHFGINDVNYPDREPPENETPLYDQITSITLISDWVSTFINKSVTDGEGAIKWMMENKDLSDPKIDVMAEF